MSSIKPKEFMVIGYNLKLSDIIIMVIGHTWNSSFELVIREIPRSPRIRIKLVRIGVRIGRLSVGDLLFVTRSAAGSYQNDNKK